jgi:16S rRNA (guanine527-N7)-methyltransferase
MIRPPRPPPSEADLAADRARALALIPVSRETLAPEALSRLDQFAALLLRWQERINLVAPSTLPVLWTRHIADSLQLLNLAPDARIWVDLGSGGGFPGLVIACALAGRPGAMVHLVESNAKKAAFLREAARAIKIPAIVHGERIEAFSETFRERADVVTARALAPLTDLLALAEPLLKTGARGLFLKGRDVEAELTAASKYWNIRATLVPSLTDPHGRIVVLDGAERIEPVR